MDWLQQIIDLVQREGTAARVVIVEASGPTPRARGASMLVWAGGQSGKIGRAETERGALREARRLIGEAAAAPGGGTPRWLRAHLRFATGDVLGEMTGGSVLVLIEAFGPAEAAALCKLRGEESRGRALGRAMASGAAPVFLDLDLDVVPASAASFAWREGLVSLASDPQRLLFRVAQSGAPDYLIERIAPERPKFHVYGTGLVARALVKVLADLPFRVVWLDTAPGHFPDGVPPGVETRAADDLTGIATAGGAGAFHAVMTAAHDLDLAVCRAVLRAGGFAYLGVIGSRLKRERMIVRLDDEGFAADQLARVACPIGLPQIRGKVPAVIAVSIAAQALAALAADHPVEGSNA